MPEGSWGRPDKVESDWIDAAAPAPERGAAAARHARVRFEVRSLLLTQPDAPMRLILSAQKIQIPPNHLASGQYEFLHNAAGLNSSCSSFLRTFRLQLDPVRAGDDPSLSPIPPAMARLTITFFGFFPNLSPLRVKCLKRRFRYFFNY